MIRFWTLGTSSGGISTPRSPRATITASASSMISSSRPSAAGFSSLTMIPAALPTSLRPSATSSGRCTKDSAIQSAPCASAKDRSARSFSVIAEIGSTACGRLTPLWFDSVPPTTISVSAKSAPQSVILSRILPSSTKRSVPGWMRVEDLGMRQRGAVPVAGRRIEIEAERVAGSDLDLAVGEIAEPKLWALQIGENTDRPSGLCFDAPDLLEQRRFWSWLPWLKFSRKTSTPASNSARSRSRLALAGPTVATILALRRRRPVGLAAPCGCAPARSIQARGRTRMARKSLTLVRVGPVTTRSPIGGEKAVAVMFARAPH